MSDLERAFIPYAHGIGFWCPGCNRVHCVSVPQLGKGEPSWSWNGDWHKPTLAPSILTYGGASERCHSFVREGSIQFLSDCGHELAGKTVLVPAHEWPQWVLDEAKERGIPWPAESAA